ncbi:MAG: BlaI/MecI/CopY family transcriptional regulator [Leucobacter sp.]|nr:BlaI/MecI/CopY family transcriptional regulator [Leucobacter sp.]
MTSDQRHTHGGTSAGEPARLGALETQVMDLLWEGGGFTVRDLIDRLPSNPAYTTIATVLGNLRKKHLVCTRKDGHTTLYAASVTREAHATSIMEHALEASGDREASILHFVNSMPEEDLRLLRQHLLGGNEPQ